MVKNEFNGSSNLVDIEGYGVVVLAVLGRRLCVRLSSMLAWLDRASAPGLTLFPCLSVARSAGYDPSFRLVACRCAAQAFMCRLVHDVPACSCYLKPAWMLTSIEAELLCTSCRLLRNMQPKLPRAPASSQFFQAAAFSCIEALLCCCRAWCRRR